MDLSPHPPHGVRSAAHPSLGQDQNASGSMAHHRASEAAQASSSIGPRLRGPASLEKWYIDVLLPDGTVLLVYLAALSLFGVRIRRVTAELFSPSGEIVRGSAKVRRVEGGEDWLHFGAASIEQDVLRFETPELSGELRYHSRHPPWIAGAPFVAEGDRSLQWIVEVPDADVEGELRGAFGTRAIRGRGYRDRVWFDLLPWRFPIRTLVWGRAAAGDHAAIWVAAQTPSGSVASAWLDGRPVESAGEGPPDAVALAQPRALLESAVMDLESLRLGPLRPLLARLSGDPYEIKWAAPCTVAGTHGVAIHERVRWRAPSRAIGGAVPHGMPDPER